MENIEQAIERARAQQRGVPEDSWTSTGVRQPGALPGTGRDPEAYLEEAELDSAYLQSNRIISHIITDPRTRPFDMLRTQILQSMDPKDWRVLAVTSPRPGCGKTVTAVNLAISIARQPERSALLVDLDLQKPKVATYLGLDPSKPGALGVLEGQTTLAQSVVRAHIGEQRLAVLPTASTIHSSEMIASRAMTAMMRELRREYYSQTIIVDLPPILTGDDVIAMLPQVDCVLLVAAVGTSTVAEIDECRRHLQSAEVVRVVLNKTSEAGTDYYYY